MGNICSSCIRQRNGNRIEPAVASEFQLEQRTTEQQGPSTEYLQKRLDSAKSRLRSATKSIFVFILMKFMLINRLF